MNTPPQQAGGKYLLKFFGFLFHFIKIILVKIKFTH